MNGIRRSPVRSCIGLNVHLARYYAPFFTVTVAITVRGAPDVLHRHDDFFGTVTHVVLWRVLDGVLDGLGSFETVDLGQESVLKCERFL